MEEEAEEADESSEEKVPLQRKKYFRNLRLLEKVVKIELLQTDSVIV